MGQAKRRGSFEERFALAKQKQAELLTKQNLALTKPKAIGHVGHKPNMVLAMLAAATMGIPTRE